VAGPQGRKSTGNRPATVEKQNSRRLPGVNGPKRQRNAMKYICLVYLSDSAFDGFTEKDHRDLDNRSIAYDQELAASGHYIGSNALQPPSTATSIRVRNKKMSMTDGPFAETKEHLGGYILIEARDLNEALQIASKVPVGELGTIEVRPIMELERTDA
jgi:hypothetical protein